MNGAKLYKIGQRRTGPEHLGTANDDPVIAFVDDPGIQIRWFLLMRWLRAVNLRRHDGIGRIDIVVAAEFVELHCVVGKLLTTACQNFRRHRISGKEARNMIGTTAHQAEGHFGCSGQRLAACNQFLGRPGHCPVTVDLVPCGRGFVGHQIRIFRRRGVVEYVGDRLYCTFERRMRRYVTDDLSVVDHMASVITNTFDILRSGSHAGTEPLPPAKSYAAADWLLSTVDRFR